MAKVTTRKDFQSPAVPKVKYYFTKQMLFENSNLLSDGFFQNPDYVGVTLFPFKHYQGKINLRMKRFISKRSNQQIVGLESEALEVYAIIDTPLKSAQVEGIDFFFLDKIQLQWLVGQLGPQDKLCFADVLVDMGLTPPFLNNGTKKYLTLKTWIEKPDLTGFITGPLQKKIFPEFSVLVPCPPMWPPNTTQSPLPIL